MPIRFACENCGVRLSVSTRKAGTQAKCPKCRGAVTIPQPEPVAERSESAAPPVPASEGTKAAQQPEDPFAQFTVFDLESELVYDTEYETRPASVALGPVDPSKLAVSRTVLYAQGALLGLVALLSFAVGVMVGLGASGDTDDADQLPQPCLISGTVVVQDNGGETRPDIGAVAVVLPRDFHPDQKAEIIGLRPQDRSGALDGTSGTAVQSGRQSQRLG